MKIQCFNERYDLLDIPIGGTLVRNQPDPVQIRKGLQRVYRFTRNEVGDLVCDVTHEDDIRRLLSIRHGYQPYGEEAQAEARAAFGWTDEPESELVDDAASGQPPVSLEMIDDDEEVDLTIDPDEGSDDSGLEVNMDLPEIPAPDADGQLWMRYAAQLPGVDDPGNKDQLEAYARNNYGVDLDKRAGLLKLIKEIAKLQAAKAG